MVAVCWIYPRSRSSVSVEGAVKEACSTSTLPGQPWPPHYSTIVIYTIPTLAYLILHQPTSNHLDQTNMDTRLYRWTNEATIPNVLRNEMLASNHLIMFQIEPGIQEPGYTRNGVRKLGTQDTLYYCVNSLWAKFQLILHELIINLIVYPQSGPDQLKSSPIQEMKWTSETICKSDILTNPLLAWTPARNPIGRSDLLCCRGMVNYWHSACNSVQYESSRQSTGHTSQSYPALQDQIDW